ncbi:MAG: conjugal transfer protein TraX [Bacteroides sp.]|nr:conjugal transfer protein TraX [Bacteroides sp.]MCM1550784.1 conjugal transfer protein TraX [Clostridium sp.]
MEAVGTQEGNGISGSTIKMIAIIAMLIDHTAAVVLEHMILKQHLSLALEVSAPPMVILYYIMRIIGRLGFPIFIFLLIEGLEHTRNKWKYLLRLVLFALVSEIPFDFAFNLKKEEIFSGKLLEFGYQNVFFTLSIGLLTVIVIQIMAETKWNTAIKTLMNLVVTLAGMGLGFLLRTDYGAIGVLAIVILYLFRKRRLLAAGMACVILMGSSILEVSAFLILLPIAHYNGKRGWNLKYVFYAFYPLHLLLLWGLCLGMGIL